MKYESLLGLKIVPDRNISDLIYRNWKQRLFSWPWRPWITYEKGSIAYMIDGLVIVSYETYEKIKKERPELCADNIDISKHFPHMHVKCPTIL